MDDVLDLWLIRHGETAWNASQRVQGNSDVPLNETGVQQAKALAKRIGHKSFDAVYASDLSRAYHTAELCFPTASIRADKRIREIHLGDFEGRIWPDFTEDEREQASVWFMGPYDQRVPGGESSDDLRSRAKAWLADLPQSGRVIAFAHGGTIATILHLFVGRPKPRTWDDSGGWGFRLKNTSISRLFLSEQYTTVETINDYAHLEELSKTTD